MIIKLKSNEFIRWIQSKTSSSNFDQFDQLSKLTSSKKQALSNLNRILQFQKSPIVLICINENEVLFTSGYDEVIPGTSSFSGKNKREFNCFAIQDGDEDVLHIEVDIEQIFHYSVAKKVKLPVIEDILWMRR